MRDPRDALTSGGHRLVIAYGRVPAHDLLRREVAAFHDVSPVHVVIGHACARCGSDAHGWPHVLPSPALRHPAHVSVSRAGALSVVAVTDAGPVGIDAEDPAAAALREIDAVVLHPSERARGADPARTWVRKEAVLKACGLGLRVDPGSVALDGDGIVAWESDEPHPGEVRLRDLGIPGVVAAVALIVRAGQSLDDVAMTCHGTTG